MYQIATPVKNKINANANIATPRKSAEYKSFDRINHNQRKKHTLQVLVSGMIFTSSKST